MAFSADTESELRITSLIFVDARVGITPAALSELAPETRLVVLESDQDGLSQIAAAVQGLSDLRSIHVVSHGGPGTLLLGASAITSSTLQDQADPLASIGASLASDGDLLLYGCNVAQGDLGAAFIGLLAQLTGADVAASTNLTGNQDQGGDWTLEAYVGVIDAAQGEPSSLVNSTGTLALFTGTSGNDTLTGTAAADSIVGGSGSDLLNGLGGADTLLGGLGDDRFDIGGGSGKDLIDGGESRRTPWSPTTTGDYDTLSYYSLSLGGIRVDLDQRLVVAPLQGTLSTYTTAASNPHVVVGDFNGDGQLDILSVNEDALQVTLLPGQASSTGFTFASGVSHAVGGRPGDAAVGDFNQDGFDDVAISFGATNELGLMYGAASGLGAISRIGVGATPRYTTTGDFNADGILDLATGNLGGTVSVLLGLSAGGFGAAQNISIGGTFHQPVAADFNGDGRDDLAVTETTSSRVAVLLSGSEGALGTPSFLTSGSFPQTMVAADFNADGHVDLATANRDSNNVSVFLGNGSGGFASPVQYAIGAGLTSIQADDMDGDGTVDLTVASRSDSTIRALRGAGDGTFSVEPNWVLPISDPYGIAVADLDQDGMPDMVAGPRLSGSVTVVMNSGPGADTFRGIELLGGVFNQQDVVKGRLTGGPSDAAQGSALYLSLYGGSDIVNQTPLGAQQTWADGVYVGYSWSTTGITATYIGATATVSYGAAGTQLAGTDTLTHVSLLDDSKFDDYFDLSAATQNALGYVTDPLKGKSSHTLLMGWGGSDTVVGNGLTTLYYGTVNATNNGNGISIDLRADQANLSNLSTSGTPLGVLSFSGVRGVLGTRFNDSLVGGLAENDAFERFRGYAGNDFIDGGRGLDLAIYSSALEGLSADLAQGTVLSVSEGNDTLRGIEWLSLTSFNDVVDASSFGQSGTPNQGYSWWGYNLISPRGGDDTITGNGSTFLDYEQSLVAIQADLASGVVDARVVSDKSTDAYRSLGRDTFSGVYGVRGSQYDDLLLGGGAGRTATGLPLETFHGGAGNDTLNGIAGYDVANYSSSPNAIVVDLSLASGQVQDGWGFTDTLLNIDEIQASYLDDSIRGSAEDESFAGRKGLDSIDGAGGYDEVGYWDSPTGVTVLLAAWVESSGSPTTGYTGSATDGFGTIDIFRNIEGVEGSPYNDSIVGDGNANRLDGRGGVDTLDGGAGIDWAEYNQTMQGVRVDLSLGIASDDGQGVGEEVQTASIETDILINIENVRGGYGADSIIGDANANWLQGGAAADTLVGGAGRDTLEGEAGDDLLTGGSGSDTFILSAGQDTITDFAAGDVIQISGITLTGTIVTGNGSSLGQNQVQLENFGTTTRLFFGTDSIAGADLAVTLAGTYSTAQLEVAQGAMQFATLTPSYSSRLFGGTSADRGLAIESSPAGALYLGGQIGGALSASNLASSLGDSSDANGSLFLTQLTGDANPQWTRALPGWQVNSPLVIAPTATGVIAAGTIANPSGDRDAVVRAFDETGAVLWTREIASPLGRPASSDVAYGIDATPSGEILVVGMTDGALQGQTSPSSGLLDTDIFIRKLDSGGNTLWTTALASEGTEWEIAGIRAGEDGRIYVAGSTYGNLGGEINQGVRDAFVTCLDAQGQVVWTRLIGNYNYDDAVDIEVAPDGSIWVAGLTYGQLGSNTQQGLTDAFLTRLNSDGTIVWTQTYGSATYDGFTAITPLIDGVLAVMDIADQQPAGSGQWVHSNDLLRIDGAGQEIWRADFDASVVESTLAADGRVLLIGTAPGAFGGVTGLGQGDVLLARVDFNRAPTGSVSISGLPAVGETLSATNSLVDVDGIPESGSGALTYRWFANGTSLPDGSGSSYTLTRAEIGKAISVVATYTDQQGHLETLSSVSTAPVSPGPGGVNLYGMAYHWKSHMLLSGVEVQTVSSEAGISNAPPAVLDLRGVSINEESGSGNKTVSVQVWVNALEGDADFQFEVSAAQAVSASFVSALSDRWTVLPNTLNPSAITVGGFDSGSGAATGPVQLGTLQFVFGPEAETIEALFSGISVGAAIGADLALTVASDTSDGQGGWSVSGLPAGSYGLRANRNVADSSNAITSADALAALRIAVGLNPNVDPDGSGPLQPLRISPYQFMAADANASGTVTSADALAILRMAVKLPSALPKEWFFVEEGRDFWNEGSGSYSMSRTASSWNRAIEANLNLDETLNLVGVLKGDVNGSWSAPAGSVDLDALDPNYFSNLATRLVVPTDQWGV